MPTHQCSQWRAYFHSATDQSQQCHSGLSRDFYRRNRMQENLGFCSHALPCHVRPTNQDTHSPRQAHPHKATYTHLEYGMEERFAFRFPSDAQHQSDEGRTARTRKDLAGVSSLRCCIW
ncbi:hypothetical protein TNCV_2461291 [Trichonephila clavipes]|nr:hypothetical protein TNCV_2461291 [Trichonephila clavipes]